MQLREPAASWVSRIADNRGSSSILSLRQLSGWTREYWMIYRGPGYLAVVWSCSSPRQPPPPLPSASCLSFSVFLCVAQRGRRLEKRPNKEARLVGWRKMTQPGEICVMIDASEGVLYRLAEPRAAKPVIKSKHELRGHAWQIFSSKWGAAGWGGIAYVYVWQECSHDPPPPHRKETLDSLLTFSAYVLHRAGGGAWSRIIGAWERLALFKSFNILWSE